MSSWNVHKRHVLDSNLPLSHRFSHLRSLVNIMQHHFQCDRAEVVRRLKDATGVHVEGVAGRRGRTAENLAQLLSTLEHWRDTALDRTD